MTCDPPAVSTLSVKAAYRTFLSSEEGACIYARFKQILYSGEDSMVDKIAAILREMPDFPSGSIRVCDIGGGDGARISRILRLLHCRSGARCELDFVEQSPSLMRRFDAERIADFARVRKFPMLFEDAKLDGGYDLVFLIHSIFAFQDANTFEEVLRLRGENGFIILVTNSGDSFLAGLKRILDRGYIDRRFEIDDLLTVLRVREIPFEIRQFQTIWRIGQDSLDTDGRAIEEWLTLGSPRPEEISRMFQSYILDRSSPAGEARLFSEDEVVVLIPPISRMEFL